MVSIIIVNYKLKKELFFCIDSIINKNQGIEYEIIVVDNSEKNEIEKDLKKKYKKVKYYKPDKNLGYGNGNNFGVEKAKGDFVFILNPDTKMVNGKISPLINFIKKNKKIGAVAPQLLDSKNNVYDEQGAQELTPLKAIFVLSFLNKIFKNNRIYKKYWGIPWNKKKPKNVDVIPGTAFVIKKDLFEKIGGFDSKYFLYFEEFDLCKRLVGEGYRNYILPDLKLNHIWGASTSKNKSSKNYFLESRFYYFRKNFGILKSLTVELFLRINKESILLLGIIILALFLRLYDLPAKSAFIGDTAWFFVSAKNILESGNIPLVGITSSHPWLSQGAFWTYILAFVLPLLKFNPVLVAYLTAVLDVVTLLAIFIFCKKFFSVKVAFFSAFFYATSSLVILTSQIPYHTYPIPILTVLLMFCVLKWIQGHIKYFPFIFLLIALLYNFEISILPLGFTFAAIFLYGLVRRTDWFKKILNLKIIIYSLLALIIPMIPMIIYDLNHGFSQTLKVFVWIGYKIAVTFGYPPLHPDVQGETWKSFIVFLSEYVKLTYFLPHILIALILLFGSILFAMYKIYKSKLKDVNLIVILIFFILPAFSYFVAKTNSSAYLPMLIPQAIILVGYLFGSINKKYIYFSIVIVILMSFINIVFYRNYDATGGINNNIEIAKEILKQANGDPYNIVILGESGRFKSSVLNYEYLTWWLGHGPSDKNEGIKVYVNEKPGNIIIERGF